MKDSFEAIMNRIGCSSITFSHLPIDRALEKIAENGFHPIDIGINPAYCPHLNPLKWTKKDEEELSQTLKKLNLRVSSLNVSTTGFAPRYSDESLEFIGASIKIAKQLGAYTVTVLPGPAVDKAHWLDASKKAAINFKRLAIVAEESGIRLSIESPHSNTLAENYSQSAQLFEIINDSKIGCTFDTSHGQRNDPRPIVDGISAIGAEIVHVHLRDSFWKDYSLTPGKGVCDYLPFIKHLNEKGYKGDFNFELESGHSDPVKELQFAKTYINLILAGNKIPEDFAIWKKRSHQIRLIIGAMIKKPQTFILSQPSLKKLLTPVARYLKGNMPKFYIRYEAAWRLRFSMQGSNQVNSKKIKSLNTKKQKSIRVAILGCGSVGFNMQGPAFARLPNVEIVGVSDIKYEAAEKTAHKLGCDAFEDISELVHKAKPDLVANCTKEWAHSATTMFLLNNGIDVFCEKIMAESLASGEAMVKCAQENHRVLAVNFNWRYLPGIIKIKQIKDSGILGKLCVLRFFCHAWVWHHVLDLVDFLGGRSTSVSAIIHRQPVFNNRNPWNRFADELLYMPDIYSIANIETSEDVGVTITSSDLWNPAGCLFNLDAIFQKGSVSLSGVRSHDPVGLISCNVKNVDIKSGLIPKEGPNKFAITFQRSIAKFVDAYEKGLPVPTSGEQGLRIMKIENSVIQSANSGKKVLI